MSASLLTSPSFLQTPSWAAFWQEAMSAGHDTEVVTYADEYAEISAHLYHYPWHINQRFSYLPKGPVWKSLQKTSPGQRVKSLREFWAKVIRAVAQAEVTYLKADFDPVVLTYLGVENNETLLELLETIHAPNGRDLFPKLNLHYPAKTLQYLQTMTLDGSDLQDSNKSEYTVESLRRFYEDNPDFWAKTNQNVRRYTRKSLQEKWRVRIGSNPESFARFWEVYEATAKRQNFATHPRAYFEVLAKKSFSRIITLDLGGSVECVWFGVASGPTLTYLYGGNTQTGLRKKAQYLMHLAALKLLSEQKLTVYDLGGYDPAKGFGKFKEGYRGQIVSYLGPVDVIRLPQKYHFTNKFVGAAKSLTSLIR